MFGKTLRPPRPTKSLESMMFKSFESRYQKQMMRVIGFSKSSNNSERVARFEKMPEPRFESWLLSKKLKEKLKRLNKTHETEMAGKRLEIFKRSK